jgi:hypothetical protein
MGSFCRVPRLARHHGQAGPGVLPAIVGLTLISATMLLPVRAAFAQCVPSAFTCSSSVISNSRIIVGGVNGTGAALPPANSNGTLASSGASISGAPPLPSSAAVTVGGGVQLTTMPTTNTATATTSVGFSVISLLSNNTITIEPGQLPAPVVVTLPGSQGTVTVTGTLVSNSSNTNNSGVRLGGGGFNTGPDTINFGANNMLTIGTPDTVNNLVTTNDAAPTVLATGINQTVEPINVEGYGNTITNYGTIRTTLEPGVSDTLTVYGSAIYLQNYSQIGGTLLPDGYGNQYSNKIENYGSIITESPTALAIGGGSNTPGLWFINETDALVNGTINLTAMTNNKIVLFPGS